MTWGRNPGRGRPHARVALETPHGQRAGVGEWSPPAPAHHTHFLPAPSPETVNLRRQTRRAKGQDGAAPVGLETRPGNHRPGSAPGCAETPRRRRPTTSGYTPARVVEGSTHAKTADDTRGLSQHSKPRGILAARSLSRPPSSETVES